MTHTIKRMRVADLNPAPYNPRKISDRALEGLRNSVKRFGVVQPVIFNERTGHIVGGHQRVKALQAEGVTETDVVIVDMPEAEEKALNITLNNHAISGEFTPDIEALLGEIQSANPELFADLHLGDLEESLAEMLKLPPVEVEEDEIPEPPTDPITVRGDVWLLGDHRLVC
jgi:ParB-like chromosome segregation protein Spo0J